MFVKHQGSIYFEQQLQQNQEEGEEEEELEVAAAMAAAVAAHQQQQQQQQQQHILRDADDVVIYSTNPDANSIGAIAYTKVPNQWRFPPK